MNVTSEQNDEQAVLKRRSSILKLPKNKNIEAPDKPCEDTLIDLKSTRRVSFASSNFIKPFVTDPEKNTIWDTTYEEEINHTDSTQSSQEHVANSCSKIESTFFTSGQQSSANVTKMLVSDMDLTRGAIFEDKENIPHLVQRASIIDYAKKISNTQKHITGNNVSEVMEFTCVNPYSEIDMDLTQMPRSEDTQIFPEAAADMEFTCQMPTITFDQIPMQLSKTRDLSTIDMEFTCQIPQKVSAVLDKTNLKQRNLKLTCQPSRYHEETMELTYQIPSFRKVEETTQFEGDIDFTCQKTNIDEHSCQPLTTETTLKKMDFTCQNLTLESVTAELKENKENLFTEEMSIPSDPEKISNSENIAESQQGEHVSSSEHTLITSYPVPEEEKENYKVVVTPFSDVCKGKIELEKIENKDKNVQITIPCKKDKSDITLNDEDISNIDKTITHCLHGEKSLTEVCPMDISYMETSSMSSLKKSKIPLKCTTPLKDETSSSKLKNTPESLIKNVTIEASLNDECLKINECVLKPDESKLDLTCTSFVEEKVHGTTVQKTPESSFHINLSNISSGVDDTQHLIHCTYSKAYSNSFAKMGNDHFKDKTIGHITLPIIADVNVSISNETKIDDVKDASSFDTSFVDLGRNKLVTVNDTYVLKGKTHNERVNDEFEETLADVEKDDSSLGYLDLGEINNDFDMLTQTKTEGLGHDPNFDDWLKEFHRADKQLVIKRVTEIADVIESITKQRAEIKEYLENFEFMPVQIPPKLTYSAKSLKDVAHPLKDESSVAECKELSLEEKIRKHQESSCNCWQLVKGDGDNYTFSTLFGTLVFVVEINDSGMVCNIEKRNHLADNSVSIAMYIMKLFMDKLDSQQLKSALGKHYDVLSLLDYVQMTMIKLIDLQECLVQCDILTLEENFLARFKILSTSALLSCEVSVDVCDLENINVDDIQISCKIGAINENEFKKMIERCPKGYGFFTEFIHCIEDFLKIKEKRKLFEKTHACNK